MHNIPRMTADRLREIAKRLQIIASRLWNGLDGTALQQAGFELRAHADELEKREKAGVDAPVEGMQTKEWREKLLAEACTSSVYSTNAYFVLKSVIKSHDICERALREAQAQLSDIRKAVDVHGGLSLFPMVEAVAHLAKANRANQADLDMAEKRIAALEKALREAQAGNQVLRRKIHIVERHNQMFERCESAWWDTRAEAQDALDSEASSVDDPPIELKIVRFVREESTDAR